MNFKHALIWFTDAYIHYKEDDEMVEPCIVMFESELDARKWQRQNGATGFTKITVTVWNRYWLWYDEITGIINCK